MDELEHAKSLGGGESDDPAEGFYVIVGRGVSAWYNHLTLVHPDNLWGHKRLSNSAGGGPDDPRVMHIGYPDPWSRRQGERMGQWPRMLDFFDGIAPGLGLGSRVEPAEKQNDWLRADHFAAALQEVEQYVAETFYSRVTRDAGPMVHGRGGRSGLVLKPGFVGVIETRDEAQARWSSSTLEPEDGYLPRPELARLKKARRSFQAGADWLNDACPYRISVYHHGELSYVYAYKIDVCTGPGQPRLIVAEPSDWAQVFASPDLYDEHLPQCDVWPVRRTSDDGLPRIVNGNTYVGSTNDAWQTVVVYGMNPVGAQCVQSALAMPLADRASGVQRVWFVAEFDAKTIDQGAPNDDHGAVVDGHRNLLELVGNSRIPKEVGDQIKANHRPHPEWGPWEEDEGARDRAFKDRLHLLAWHRLDRISEQDGKILCRFVQPTDHYLTTISLPENVPELAEASLMSMLKCIDRPWVPRKPSDDLVPGMVTKVEGDALLVESIMADLLVYSRGQQQDERREGTASYLTRNLGEMVPIYVETSSHFPVGVTDRLSDPEVDGIGRLRVLGSAMLGLAGFPAHVEFEFNKKHHDHTRSVPLEGAGGGNLVVSINNIRRANHFVERRTRLNTASEEELTSAGVSAEGVRRILEIRSGDGVVRGHTVEGFRAALMLEEYEGRDVDVGKLENDPKFTY